MVACSLVAHQARAEEAPAATPTQLSELMNKVDRAGSALDSYLIMEMDADGEKMSAFMRWRIEPTERGVTISVRNGQAGEDASMQSQVAEYGRDGKLIRFTNQSSFGAEYSSETTGVVQGDELVMTGNDPFAIEPEGKPNKDNRRVIKLSDMEDVVPTSWLPLAIGYHLREENPVFQIRMADYGERFGTQVMTFEDIGTEAMQVRGEEKTVHVLIGKMGFEADEHPDADVQVAMENQVMHLRCLPSGEIVQMKISMGEAGFQMEMTANSATEAEVREKFGDAAVDGEAAEGEANDQDAGE